MSVRGKEKLPKLESLQALRAIAFLGIFTSHCALSDMGSWGVSVFLILSGFVMIYNYLPNYEKADISFKSNLAFSFNKIKRLYPLHIFMTVVAFPILIDNYIGKFGVQTILQICFRIFANVTLIQSWFPQLSIRYSMNNLSWYLCVCAFLYFCFPYIISCISKYKTIKKAIIVMCMTYIFQIVLGWGINYEFIKLDPSGEIVKGLTYNSPMYRLIDFIIGCNLGYIFLNIKQSEKTYIKSSLYEIVALVVTIALLIINNEYNEVENLWWTRTSLYTISSVFIVYFFARCNGVITKMLTNRRLIALGNISAFTYLIHEMVIRYINVICTNFLGIEITMVIRIILAIVAFVCTLISVKIWFIISEFIKNKKERYL